MLTMSVLDVLHLNTRDASWSFFSLSTMKARKTTIGKDKGSKGKKLNFGNTCTDPIMAKNIVSLIAYPRLSIYNKGI